MRDGGASIALVYCWFACIDGADNVLSIKRSNSEGYILDTLLRRNVIGNGSSPLFRRAAFDSVGGFSDDLSHAEDLAIYLATAERYEIGLVPQILVGYRLSNDSLSANGADIYHYTYKVMTAYVLRYPAMAKAISLHLRGVLMWQIVMALRRRRPHAALRLLGQDYGLIGTIVTLYIPELLAALWHGTVRENWIAAVGKSRRRAFHAFAEAQAASSPGTR
jgi:hypothetical protein